MLQQNKIHRIHLNNVIELGNNIDVEKDVSNHIKNVLRLKDNQQIKIFNGDGKEYFAKIQYQAKSLVICPSSESRYISKNDHQIVLAQCISNSKAMDLTIQKSTELGIDHVIPIISARSHPGHHEKKMDHWNKIIIHATEQSNGLYLPILNKAVIFKTDSYTPHGFTKINSNKRISLNMYFYTTKNLSKSKKKHKTIWR